MGIVSELEKYYRENHIGAQDSEWAKANKCRQCFEETEKKQLRLTSPEEAYVGEQYETGGATADGARVPRLLFVSLDPGGGNIEENGEDNPEARTMKAVRDFVIRNKINDPRVDGYLNAHNRHWYQTHWIAAQILAPFLKFDVKQDLEGALEAVKPWFAHCRAVRCSQNKKNKAMVDKLLFDNCNEFLRDEILILSPDILISQGRDAADAIVKAFEKDRVPIDQKYKDWVPLDQKYYEEWKKPDDGKILWIPIYHPRYGRYFTVNQPGFIAEGCYRKKIEELYLSNRA